MNNAFISSLFSYRNGSSALCLVDFQGETRLPKCYWTKALCAPPEFFTIASPERSLKKNRSNFWAARSGAAQLRVAMFSIVGLRTLRRKLNNVTSINARLDLLKEQSCVTSHP